MDGLLYFMTATNQSLSKELVRWVWKSMHPSISHTENTYIWFTQWENSTWRHIICDTPTHSGWRATVAKWTSNIQCHRDHKTYFPTGDRSDGRWAYTEQRYLSSWLLDAHESCGTCGLRWVHAAYVHIESGSHGGSSRNQSTTNRMASRTSWQNTERQQLPQ